MARRSPEQLLLSSIIRDGDFTTATARGASADWFHVYSDEWEWIERYYRRNQKVPSRLAFKGQFPDFRIMEVNDTGHYAEETQKAHVKHMLADVMQTSADMLSIGDVEGAARALHTGVITVQHSMSGMSEDSDVIANFDDILDEVQARYDRVAATGMAGIPTGFTTLDDRTGGPQPGHLWVIAARPGERKTWTMIRMGAAACMGGYTIQYDALEMTRPEVASRLHTFLASDSGKQVFNSMSVMQGKDFSMLQYRKFLKELRGTVGGKFHVSDTQRGKVSSAVVAAQIEKNRPAIMFIDYITLMANSGNDSDHLAIAELMGELKSIAGQYQIPIVVASQLNRTGAIGKDAAGLEALSRSDGIGQDADAVITMKKQSRSITMMKLVKFRHGPDGFRWWCEFNPKTGTFKEVSRDKAMDIKDGEMDEEDWA